MNINKVLVLNEGYSDNLGDQAINDSLQYLLKCNAVDSIEFQDFTKNINEPLLISTNDKKIHRKSVLFNTVKQMIPSKIKWIIRNINRIIKTSKNNYDLIIIGGGQLILSNASFAIAMFLWVFFLRMFGNTNIVLFAVGSGTKFGLIDKILFRYTLEKVSKIYVRDYKSQKILINIFNVNAYFIYDVAFIHNKFERIDTSNRSTLLLGITSFNVYNRYNDSKITKEEFFESWIKLLIDNSIDLSGVKLFYTTQDDRFASLEFKNYVFQKYSLNLELIETNTKNILINQLSKSKIIISGRMHALILGLTYGCEIIPYLISDKLKEFYEMYRYNFDINKIQTEIELKIKEVINE